LNRKPTPVYINNSLIIKVNNFLLLQQLLSHFLLQNIAVNPKNVNNNLTFFSLSRHFYKMPVRLLFIRVTVLC